MSWHASLPWLMLKRKYYKFRSRFFSLPRHEGPYYRVVVDGEEDLEEILGVRHFYPNSEFSYDKGEDLNLALPVYGDHSSIDASPIWWQYHVRGYEVASDVWELTCHLETQPTEHPKLHLRGEGLSVLLGMKKLKETLDDAGLEHERVTYERE